MYKKSSKNFGGKMEKWGLKFQNPTDIFCFIVKFNYEVLYLFFVIKL